MLTTPVDPTEDMVLAHLYDDGIPFLRLGAALSSTVCHWRPDTVLTGVHRLMCSLV